MKPRHASTAAAAIVLAAASAFVALATLGCAHPQKRNDWHTPSPPMTCTSDADCRGGVCAIEIGASQGTCGPAGGSPGAPGDGGAPGLGPAPAPSVQPSPSDIQI